MNLTEEQEQARNQRLDSWCPREFPELPEEQVPNGNENGNENGNIIAQQPGFVQVAKFLLKIMPIRFGILDSLKEVPEPTPRMVG